MVKNERFYLLCFAVGQIMFREPSEGYLNLFLFFWCKYKASWHVMCLVHSILSFALHNAYKIDDKIAIVVKALAYFSVILILFIYFFLLLFLYFQFTF